MTIMNYDYDNNMIYYFTKGDTFSSMANSNIAAFFLGHPVY